MYNNSPTIALIQSLTWLFKQLKFLRMKMFKSLLAFVVLLSSTGVFAQEEIIVIDRKDFRKKEKEIRLNDNTRVIKFAPLHLLAGEINFGYEHQLSQKGSIDLELGPTISQIGLGINNHFVDPFNPSIAERSALGAVIGVGYRYYPLDKTEALNRFYISPTLRLKWMNTLYEDPAGLLQGSQRGGITKANFTFNFGYQVWASESFAMDFYMGFGIGLRGERWYSFDQTFQNNEWSYNWIEHNTSGAVYVGNMGIKVGIGSK